jgi:D-xylose transport system substrate-binding protein
MAHTNGSVPRRGRVALAAITVAGLLVPVSQGAASAQPTSPDLHVLQVAGRFVDVPVGVNSVSATATQQGRRNWNLFFANESSTAVTNASETVNSGFDPSGFDWNGAVTSFPATRSTPGIAAGEQWGLDGLLSNVPVTFSLGYGSTRAVSPVVIPAGGGRQTVTVTLTPVDPRFTPPADPDLGKKASFNVILGTRLPGVRFVSWTDPTNLEAGEILESLPGDSSHHWRLSFPQHLNRRYTFTAVLDVPNPSGVPRAFSPDVAIRGQADSVVCAGCTGSSVTAKEPTLDGGLPGVGAVTYSVADTDRTWQVGRSDAYDVQYQGTTSTPATPVTIAVNPDEGGHPSPVNVRRHDPRVSVAILSGPGFDAGTVDPQSVRLGVTGAEASPRAAWITDVNRDRRKDLLLQFSVPEAGIVCGTTSVTLTGRTHTGQAITGTDRIKTVGCGRVAGKVAVLLPDATSAGLWETWDRPLLRSAFLSLGLTDSQILVYNAHGSAKTQSAQARQAIAAGAKVLVFANLDWTSGASIEAYAKAKGVKVLDYDRLTLGGSATAYVSFSNVEVGALMGQGLVDDLRARGTSRGAMIAELNGEPTDNNSALFAQGYNSVLDPLYADGTFTKGPDQDVDNWDSQLGGTIFQQMLTDRPEIKGAITPNDGIGAAAIQVLTTHQLAGQIPVTGQDATIEGIQNVLLGYQAGTVYRPVAAEADAAAEAAVELLQGAALPSDATDWVTDPTTNTRIPTIYAPLIWVTPSNAKSTVFADGWVTAAEVCTGDVAATCTALGIS